MPSSWQVPLLVSLGMTAEDRTANQIVNALSTVLPRSQYRVDSEAFAYRCFVTCPTNNVRVFSVVYCPTPPMLHNMDYNAMVVYATSHKFSAGDTYTYKCKKGFWIAMGLKRRKFLVVKCDGGSWEPSPKRIVGCSIVVCDIPPYVDGALLEGVRHYYGDSIFYQCAKGKHFHAQHTRKMKVTCNDDGYWLPDPYALTCTDVLCTIVNLPGAVKVGDRVDMNAIVIYKCPSPRWFERDVTELITSCSEDGKWDPDVKGRTCKIINCGRPELENGMILETNFTYTQSIKLKCPLGYFMMPSAISTTTVCDISGNWYPDPTYYKCEPIKCDKPPYVLHATMSGNITFKSIMRVTCDKGYFIRIRSNYVDVRCQNDGTWSKSYGSINCLAIRCLNPPNVDHSSNSIVGTISPPNFGSRLRYKCIDQYWISSDILSSIEIHCNDTGQWEPLRDFTCTEIFCSSPSAKRNALLIYPKGVKKSSKYKTKSALQFNCRPSFWLSVQYALMEWSFTGLNSIRIVCNTNGYWEPHQHSFACKDINSGPVPIYMTEAAPLTEIFRANWAEKANITSHDVLDHPHVKAVLSGASSSWINGASHPQYKTMVQSSYVADSKIENIWDGDASTYWIAKTNKQREYQFAVYLGRLFFVEGFEIHSETIEALYSSAITNFKLSFSSNMKTFNQSRPFHIAINNVGRTYPNNTRTDLKKDETPVYFSEDQVPKMTVMKKSVTSRSSRFEDFSIPASFVQVKVTTTQNPNLPPIIQDIRLKVTPAEWAIIYPIDFITLPAVVVSVLIVAASTYYFGFLWDKSDLETVYLGLDSTNVTDPKSGLRNYFCIKLKFTSLKDIETIICRLNQDGMSHPIVFAKPKYYRECPCRHLVFFVPGNSANAENLRLAVGFLNDFATDSAEKVQKQSMNVKIAKVHIGQPLFGRMRWIKVLRGVRISSGLPVLLNFQSAPINASTAERKGKFLKDLIYHMIVNHTLLSVFINDFLRAVPRKDRSIISFTGCFLGMFIAACLLMFESIVNEVTCTGIGVISAFLSVPVLFAAQNICSKYANFSLPEALKQELMNQRGKKTIGRSPAFMKTQKLSDMRNLAKQDARVEILLQKFKNQEFVEKPTAFKSDGSTTLHVADSLLLPWRFVQKVSKKILSSGITDKQLEAAARARLRLPIRLTKSCYAIMQYRDTKSRIYSGGSTTSCPADSEFIGNDDIMSCASMWSQSTIARAWHQVHRSVKSPIKKLFHTSEPKLWSNFASRPRRFYTEEREKRLVKNPKPRAKPDMRRNMPVDGKISTDPTRPSRSPGGLKAKVWRFASFKNGGFSENVQHEKEDLEIQGQTHLIHDLNETPDKQLPPKRKLKDQQRGYLASRRFHGRIAFNPDKLTRPNDFSLMDGLPKFTGTQEKSAMQPSAGALFSSTAGERPSLSEESYDSSGTEMQENLGTGANAGDRNRKKLRPASNLVVEARTASQFYQASPQQSKVGIILWLITIMLAVGTACLGSGQTIKMPPVICAHVTLLCAYFTVVLPTEALLRYFRSPNMGRISLKDFLPRSKVKSRKRD